MELNNKREQRNAPQESERNRKTFISTCIQSDFKKIFLELLDIREWN